MNSRWKNYGLWISMFSLVGIILQAAGAFKAIGLTDETYNNVIQAVLTILTAAGVISNPKEGTGYLDKSNNEQQESI